MPVSVGNQTATQIINAEAVTINTNNVDQSKSLIEFQASLDRLVEAIAALNSSSTLSKNDAINADKAIKLAKIESEKTLPEKKSILNHLNNANQHLKSTTELTKRIGAAISAVSQLF